MGRIKKLEGYARLLNDVKRRIQTALRQAALAVNRELIALYWDIGRMIVERQQRHGWGDAVIDRLSRDLRRAFPDNRGFSRANLFRMRAFYLAYKDAAEFVAQLARQIPWWHNVVILEKVKAPRPVNTTSGRASRTAGAATSSSIRLTLTLTRAMRS